MSSVKLRPLCLGLNVLKCGDFIAANKQVKREVVWKYSLWFQGSFIEMFIGTEWKPKNTDRLLSSMQAVCVRTSTLSGIYK